MLLVVLFLIVIWMVFFGGFDLVTRGFSRLLGGNKPTLFQYISLDKDEELEDWWYANQSKDARIKQLEAVSKQQETWIDELKLARAKYANALSNSYRAEPMPMQPSYELKPGHTLKVQGMDAMLLPSHADESKIKQTLQDAFEVMVQTGKGSSFVIPSMSYKKTVYTPAGWQYVAVDDPTYPEPSMYKSLTAHQHIATDGDIMQKHSKILKEIEAAKKEILATKRLSEKIETEIKKQEENSEYQKLKEEIGW